MINIRFMTNQDISAVVAIHIEAFPGFFLTSLGATFLKVFYSYFLQEKSGIALVAANGKEIVGFVAGSIEPEGFYKRIITTRMIRFGLVALPAVVARPRILSRLLRALKKPMEVANEPGDCELMSIAVRPIMIGQGVGRKLEKTFCDEASRRGARSVELRTDASGNDAVNSFYLSSGYRIHEVITTPEKRKMNLYTKDLM